MRSFFSVTALGALLGVGLLNVVVWLFSPLLSEVFDAIWLRCGLVIIPFLVWALTCFLLGRKRESRDARLLKAATAADPAVGQARPAGRMSWPASARSTNC
jgi:hypothetical protein